MNDFKGKTSYTKEYRTLLEKLLEIQVRLQEIKSDKAMLKKIEPLIDKLLYYFTKQVDKTIALHKAFDDRWDNEADHD
jgi:CHASE3 domain sensor protein